MCFGQAASVVLPMVVGSALSGAGKAIENRENQANTERVVAARNNVLKDTLKQNRPYIEEGREVFDSTVSQYSPTKVAEGFDESVDRRVATADLPEEGEFDLHSTADTSDVINAGTAARMAEVLQKNKQRAKSMATLRAFGDTWFNSGERLSEAAQDMSIPANFINANLTLLPHLQDFAELRAYRPVSPIGGILQGAGGIVGSAAGAGAFSGNNSYFSG